MAHDHTHAGHDHAGHDHAAGASDRRLGFAVVLNVGIVAAQFVGAALSGSLALAADAAHNAGDAAGLVVSLWARRVARRGADPRRTFGYARAETVAALVNLTALVVVSVALGYEAVGRLFDPVPVEGGVVLVLGAVGLVGNAASAALLWAGARESLNMRSAVLHLVADAGASAAVMAGAVALMNGGPAWIDPALTVGISLLILRASVQGARAAIAVLMESAPVGLDLDALAEAVRGVPGVRGVHHVHVWQLDEARTACEAHVVVDDEAAGDAVRAETKRVLHERFGVSHAVLEIERAGTCENEAVLACA